VTPKPAPASRAASPAELLGALGHRAGEHAVHPERGQQEGDGAESQHHVADDADRRQRRVDFFLQRTEIPQRLLGVDPARQAPDRSEQAGGLDLDPRQHIQGAARELAVGHVDRRPRARIEPVLLEVVHHPDDG
jgi:hypothetical protein